VRWLVGIGILLLVLLVAPVLAYSLYIDSAISRAASRALGVETSTRVMLQPLRGRLRIFDLRVANPPGFDEARFLEIADGRLELEIETLLRPVIEAPLLALDGVQIALERRGSRTNYQQILENLGRPQEREAAEAPADGGRQFVIHELRIRGVRARVNFAETLGPTGAVDVEIPEIRLRDVGSGGGVTAAELADIVVVTVLTAVVKQGGRLLPAVLRRDLGQQLGRLARVAAEATGKVSGGVLDGLRDGAAGAIRDLGGILERPEQEP
jgi:hypothetical protein